MNIAERLQKEALARKKQEVEKFSSGYTAIRELYEQEYRENKNKLSSEIKQDIKLISQKYPSFQKFALYRIYKQFDFNREIANEFISIQIQKEEQPDQGDDWIEVTSKKSAFMFKMDRDNQNNKPLRSQSVPRTSGRKSDFNSYREKRNQGDKRTDISQDKGRNNSSDRRRTDSRDRRRNISGERDEYQQRRRYSPKRDNEAFNNKYRKPKPSTRKPQPQQSGNYPYSYQPRVIYVPKQQEIDDDCPYVPKSTIQQKENQISNIKHVEVVNDLTEYIKQQEQAKREREAQIEKQRQEQEEKQRLEQIRQEELRQEQIRNEQKRQEEIRLEQQRLLRLEQLEKERQIQEQERLKKEKAELEQQQKLEEQRQYEQMLQQQQAYQKQFTNQNFQPNRQVNTMFIPQQQNQQPSVYNMLMSYINYQ